MTRFYSFTPFLQNTISLNAASYLYAVHGSFIPFLLSFYRRPSPHMRCLNAASFHLSLNPFIPFIHLSSSTMNTAWSVHCILTYLNNDISCIPLNLNLLDLPLSLGSLSLHATLECVLLVNPCLELPMQPFVARRLSRKPPTSFVLEDALQETFVSKPFQVCACLYPSQA